MISATFIFKAGQFDDEFHRLDGEIAAAAKQTSGYLGEDSWEDPKSGRIANVYYWQDETGLRQLMQHPQHLQAKQHYAEWLTAYQVIVSQVLRAYGDKQLEHPTTHLAQIY